MKPLRLLASLVLLCCFATAANAANPFVYQLFSNHMVLQHDASDPVWGWTTAANTVTVVVKDQTGATAQTVTAVADSTGRWQGSVGPFGLVANNAAYSMVVSASGQTTTTFTDVLIGDVWLCSGQSNMAHVLTDYASLDSLPGLFAPDIADSVNYPNIRNSTGSSWSVSGTATTGGFSATGYFMAREIYQQQGVPIGILFAAVGGTTIERWVDAAFASSFADYTQSIFDSPGTTSDLFNSMVATLAPYRIRAAIWYQGESDVGTPEQYSRALPGMMNAYRTNFAQPNLPFLIVQLPNYMTRATLAVETGSWAELREAQLKTVAGDTNSRLVTTIDIGDAINLHPTDKPDVGLRAAWAAANLVYGQNVVNQGPLFTGATVSGSTIRCSFSNVGAGLMVGAKLTGTLTSGTNLYPVPLSPIQPVAGGTLSGFAISGTNKVYYFANAVIDGTTNTVVVSSTSVPNPVAVRYGWANNPACNLYNKITDSGGTVIDGLPASPFRNDPVYKLNVNAGAGTGYYTLGTLAALSGSSITGLTFDHWSGDTGFLSGTGVTASATISQVYECVLANDRITGAPTGLTGTPQNRQVSLNWTAIPLVHYNVKRASVSAGPYTTLASNLTGTTSYIDTAVTSGSTYYYVVSATGLLGEGPNSAPINAGPFLSVQSTAGNAEAVIAWPAYNGTADSYVVKRSTTSGGPYTTIATGLTSLTYADQSVAAGVTYYYIVTTVASGVQVGTWVQASAVPSFLPPPLQDQDIGIVNISGGAYANTSGTYTVVGAGTDIAGTVDSFNFAYTTMSGNGTITARVASQGSTGNLPKAGVMMRASLDPAAVNFYEFVSPTQYGYQARKTTGAVTAGGPATGTDKWVRVVRSSNVFTGYMSADGISWTQVGNPQAITVPDPIYVGFAVSSRDNTVTHTATFDNVSAPWVAQTPAVPSGLTATVVASGAQATLSWNAAMGAAGYNVKCSTVSGGPYNTVASGLDAVNYACTGLTPGVVYYYAISAIDAAGESANSSQAVIDLSSVPSQPMPPSGFNATVGNAQVALAWNPSAVATGYNLKRSAANGGPYSLIATLTPDSAGCLDTNQTNGVPGYYVISSLSPYGESANSAQLAATPQWSATGCTINATINGLFVTAGGTTPLIASKSTVGINETFGIVAVSGSQIAWQSVANGLFVSASATTITLTASRSTIGNTELFSSGSMGVGKISFKSAALGQYVSADAAGNNPLIANRASAGSYETFLLGGTGIATTPDGFSASGGDTSVALTWNEELGATAYSVKRATASGGPFVQIATPSANRYTDTGTNGVTYYYVVSTVSGTSGGSPNSTEVSATPQAAQLAFPTGLNATALSESQLTVSWINNAPTATACVLQRSLHGVGSWTTLSSQPPGTGLYADANLSAATSYDYRVQSTGTAGACSAWSYITTTTPAGIGDGIPGAWRLQYFGNGLTVTSFSAANADPDGDGMTNLQEFLAGTSPVDPASIFRITSIAKSGNDIVVQFASIGGKTYGLEWATGPAMTASWSIVQDNIAGTGAAVSVTDHGAALKPSRFYRVILR